MIPTHLVPEWRLPGRLRAAFSLRVGGVSASRWRSLNLGLHVGDQPDAVYANRRLLARELGLPAEPCWLDQVHGADVVDADAASPGARMVADASIARRGAVLAIQVADCFPVLLAADDGSVYAAAHAGWRGLAAGVLQATLRAMACDPRGVSAWIGPGIRQPSFEVGDEVRAAFGSQFAAAFLANNSGRWQCDLAAIAAEQLRVAGVRKLVDCGLCTYTESERFFSHRRDQAALGGSGRMAAFLWRGVS